MPGIATISPPRYDRDVVLFPDGNTNDIISTVMYADQRAGAYTREFAQTLRGQDDFQTALNIWRWLKQMIRYKLDPRGIQNIKSPGRFFADRSGDCKSYSVFTASILRNLGIDYKYRFTSYDDLDPTPTHVYVIIPRAGGGEIIIDAVWTGPFNTQKKFAHKPIERFMSTEQMAGIGTTAVKHRPGMLVITKDPTLLTDGELDLLLARQRTEIELDIARKKGHTRAVNGYNAQLGVINECLANVDNGDYIAMIGDAMVGKAKKKGGKTKAGKLLQKIGKGIKKGAKAIVKVVTAVPRLALKGAMEIYLPKASLAFLYLFADPKITLPDLAKRKQAKSEKFKKFVVSGLGMKDKHFMAIIRNALTKRFGKSPEAFLAEKFRVAAVNGIGKASKKKVARQLKKAAGKRTAPALQPDLPGLTRDAGTVLQRSAAAFTEEITANAPANAIPASEAGGKVINSLFRGDIIGAAMSAIAWLVSKIGGKKNKGEAMDFTEADFPDPDNDLQNAFQFKDLKSDFSAVPEIIKNEIKEKVTELIVENKAPVVAQQELVQQFPQLDTSQVRELVQEVEEGAEPVSESEAYDLASKVKQGANAPDNFNKNGGGSKGFCGGLFG